MGPPAAHAVHPAEIPRMGSGRRVVIFTNHSTRGCRRRGAHALGEEREREDFLPTRFPAAQRSRRSTPRRTSAPLRSRPSSPRRCCRASCHAALRPRTRRRRPPAGSDGLTGRRWARLNRLARMLGYTARGAGRSGLWRAAAGSGGRVSAQTCSTVSSSTSRERFCPSPLIAVAKRSAEARAAVLPACSLFHSRTRPAGVVTRATSAHPSTGRVPAPP